MVLKEIEDYSVMHFYNVVNVCTGVMLADNSISLECQNSLYHCLW